MTEPIRLDSAQACMAELARLHTQLARLPHQWASKAREVSVAEQALEVAEAVAFLEADGATATERKAQATRELADNAETSELAQSVAKLKGEIEALRRVFSVYERQSSIAQSILAMHREEGTYQ